MHRLLVHMLQLMSENKEHRSSHRLVSASCSPTQGTRARGSSLKCQNRVLRKLKKEGNDQRSTVSLTQTAKEEEEDGQKVRDKMMRS